MSQPPPTHSLILVPALITFGVTILRLSLELAGIVNPAGGVSGSLVGIAWLPLVFGPYFALQIRPHVETRGALIKALMKTLLAYGLAARLPVIAVTLVPLYSEWGTHYEVIPFDVSMAAKVGITITAQLVFWVCLWTLGIGTLAGVLVSGLKRPESAVQS